VSSKSGKIGNKIFNKKRAPYAVMQFLIIANATQKKEVKVKINRK